MPPPAVWGSDRGVFPQECSGGRRGQQSVPRRGLLNDKDTGERKRKQKKGTHTHRELRNFGTGVTKYAKANECSNWSKARFALFQTKSVGGEKTEETIIS